METFIILGGSVILPAVVVAALIVCKRIITKENQSRSAKDQELIGTLEELVALKNEQIKRLK